MAEQDSYAPTHLFIVKYRFNAYSIYRVKIAKGTPKLWHIAKGDTTVESIAGEKHTAYLPQRLEKRSYDWFFTLEEAKKFTIKKIEALVARMRGNIEALEGTIQDLRQ